jgi:triacylglycerol lipase
VHVGAQITVDSGGPGQIGWRRSLIAYQNGLSALIAAQK